MPQPQSAICQNRPVRIAELEPKGEGAHLPRHHERAGGRDAHAREGADKFGLDQEAVFGCGIGGHIVRAGNRAGGGAVLRLLPGRETESVDAFGDGVAGGGGDGRGLGQRRHHNCREKQNSLRKPRSKLHGNPLRQSRNIAQLFLNATLWAGFIQLVRGMGGSPMSFIESSKIMGEPPMPRYSQRAGGALERRRLF
jgi:hypothetical protein